MSYNTLFGAKFNISTGFGSAVTLSSISNNAPPVGTTASAHGFSAGDELLILNNWDDYNESIIKTGTASGSTFNIPGYDTSDSQFYPPASSGGTVQKVSGWLELGQVLNITSSGGDASFEDLKPYDRRNGIKVFQGFSGASIEFTLGWDRSRGDQQALRTSSRVGGKRAVKFLLPGGVVAYAYGVVSASPLPTFESTLKQKVVFTMNGMLTDF